MKKHQVIQKPLITEKSSRAQADANQYFFRVDSKANKYDIRRAVEEIFNVKVAEVKTMNVLGKRKRVGKSIGLTSNWKKAMVTLKEGDRIEFLEGK
ncbi:MAG: 50S ribosomal protein L23 [Pseudomonadota bacterium]